MRTIASSDRTQVTVYFDPSDPDDEILWNRLEPLRKRNRASRELLRLAVKGLRVEQGQQPVTYSPVPSFPVSQLSRPIIQPPKREIEESGNELYFDMFDES